MIASQTQYTRPRLYAAAVLCAVVALLAGPASSASAHPSLVQTAPAGGAVAASAPENIQLGFSERVVPRGSSVSVRDGDGHAVAIDPLSTLGGGTALQVHPSDPLKPGIYSVRWSVLGDDGHQVGGRFSFGVPDAEGHPPPGAERLAGAGSGLGSGTSPGEGLLTVLSRWLGLIAASALFGGAILIARLAGRLEPEDRDGFDSAWRVLVLRVWIGAAILAALEAVIARVQPPGGGIDFGLLVASGTGALALAQLILAVVGGAVVIAVARHRVTLAGVLGFLLLLVHALDGHVDAIQSGRLLAQIVQVLHLAGVGVWIGGLITLATCIGVGVKEGRRSQALRVAGRAFGPIAGAAAVVVVGTGVLAAIREVSHWYFLFWSGYGRVLLLKSLGVVVILVLGFIAWRRFGRDDADERGRGWRLIRAEAVTAVVVILLAATMAGLVQGRGQPLPAQRGNLFAGPAFATLALKDGVGRMTLAPARTGPNRLTLYTAPGTDVDAVKGIEPDPKSISAKLSCNCSQDGVEVDLKRASGGAWVADVDLPADGAWGADLTVDGKPVTPALLPVGAPGLPGADPLVIAFAADLSGPGAERCRNQAMGLDLAVAQMNAGGGLEGGRKVTELALDDGGDPARAKQLMTTAIAAHDPLAIVACGGGSQGAIDAAAGAVPTIATDQSIGPVHGEATFRLAPDPAAEGVAAAQFIAQNAFAGQPTAPHRVVAIGDGSEDSDLRIEGLTKTLEAADIDVDEVLADSVADPADLRKVLDRDRYVTAYLDVAHPVEIEDGLDSLAKDRTFLPTSILTSSRLYSESFLGEAGNLGRQGLIRSVGDIDPVSADGLRYANLSPLFVGERASVDGLRAFVAGRALSNAFEDGTDAKGVIARLLEPPPFSTAALSPWSAKAPADGTLIFGIFNANFLPDTLIPTSSGGHAYEGRYFTDGAWIRSNRDNFGPLTAPQASP
ncbi:MAG: copper transport protein [Thermoleophilaceae bacterium]|nr:copper transport protein [Thermoleophilaceae bacterium]